VSIEYNDDAHNPYPDEVPEPRCCASPYNASDVWFGLGALVILAVTLVAIGVLA
jgi:hypothetical protein